MSPERVDVHQIAERRLANTGLRYTANRRALVSALQETSAPMSIPELMRLIPGATGRVCRTSFLSP